VPLARPASTRRTRFGWSALRASPALVVHDQHFDAVFHADHYDQDADDKIYTEAHRLLDGDTNATTTDARANLQKIDLALKKVPDLLRAGRQQLDAGQDYAEAQARTYGRAEIKMMGARVGTLGPLAARFTPALRLGGSRRARAAISSATSPTHR